MLDDQGSRRYVYPADVRGQWSRLKPFVEVALIAIYVSLPLIQIGGHPAIWIDLPERHFYLFGATFNAQDFYLAFFAVSGIGFFLIVLAGLFGRIWCGWACPQTVFLGGVFRRVERWIEGPAERRRKLASAPMSPGKFWLKLTKHVIYFVLSAAIAHVFLAYFASAAQLGKMITEGPGEHPGTFAWAVVMTAVSYGNFWWFREQLCIVVCPYGRLQSVLQDKDTINVIYDHKRGEPRGKAKAKDAGLPATAARGDTTARGDCVDCGRCIAVCPTRIDIRQGLQLECIGCGLCADACDEVMVKLARAPGLIRHDSLRMVEEGRRRFWRPRVFFYIFMGLVGLTVATVLIARNDDFEAEVLRASGTPFTITATGVDNQVRVHVVNKAGETAVFHLHPNANAVDYVTLPQPFIMLAPFADHDLPVVVHIPTAEWKKGITLDLEVTSTASPEVKHITIDVLGPNRLAHSHLPAPAPAPAPAPTPAPAP